MRRPTLASGVRYGFIRRNIKQSLCCIISWKDFSMFHLNMAGHVILPSRSQWTIGAEVRLLASVSKNVSLQVAQNSKCFDAIRASVLSFL